MDIFFVQARTSPMETKRLLDAGGDDPYVSMTIVYKWHLRFKEGLVFFLMTNEKAISPDLASIDLTLFLKCYLKWRSRKQRFSDQSDLRYATKDKI